MILVFGKRALRGADGVDDTTVKFLLRAELKKKKKEDEEEERKAEEEKHERSEGT